MGKSLIDRIQAKLELFRLEQRYTRHRQRRSTFVSNAIYVDGEYVYQFPNTTGSSTGSSSSSARVDALHSEKPPTGPSTAESTNHMAAARCTPQFPPAEGKRLNCFSSMPGFGSSFVKDRPRTLSRQPSTVR